jgi:hypothetical protein
MAVGSNDVRLVRASFPLTGPTVRLLPERRGYLVEDAAGSVFTFADSEVKSWTVVDAKTPVWAIVLSVVLFPMGLLFLFAKEYHPRQAYVMTLHATDGAWVQVSLQSPPGEVRPRTVSASRTYMGASDGRPAGRGDVR